MGHSVGRPRIEPWLGIQSGGASALAAWTHPDGSVRFATAGTDSEIQVWDSIVRGPVGPPLIGHNSAIWALASWIDPAGNPIIASAGEDGTIRIWDPTKGISVGEPLKSHNGPVWALAAWKERNSSTRLASAGEDGTVRIWDPSTGLPVGQPLVDAASFDQVRAMAVSFTLEGAPRLACAGRQGSISVWDPSARTAVFRSVAGHKGWVRALAYWTGRSGASVLVSGGDDGNVRIWDAETMAARQQLVGHTGQISALACWAERGGGRNFASGSDDGTIRVWAIGVDSAIHILDGHGSGVRALAVSTNPNGDTRLISAAANGTVRIWDPDVGNTIGGAIDAGHAGWIRALSGWTSCDGSPRLASISGDGTVRVWNPDTGIPIGDPITGPDSGVRGLTSWTEIDGQPRVAAVTGRATIHVWNPDGATSIGRALAVDAGPYYAVTNWLASNGARMLACADYGHSVHLRDATTGDAVGEEMAGHTRHVLALIEWTTSDGITMLASGSYDGSIRIWKLDEGIPIGGPLLGHSGGVSGLVQWLTRNGNARLASASLDATIRIWDPATGRTIGKPLVGHTDAVWALTAWTDSSGSTFLASGSLDGTVRIWEGDTGRPFGKPLKGHKAGIRALTHWVSSGGVRIASAGYDGSIRLWNPENGRAIRTIEVGPVEMWGLSDAPANIDALDRQSLATAVAEQLSHRPLHSGGGPRGPSVVTIEGPWGSGKSTLMDMIRRTLMSEQSVSPSPQAEGTDITVRDAVRQLRRYRGPRTVTPGASTPARQHLVTAWFNAWTHQSGEHVWAGLANEIIEAAAPILYPSEQQRARYWFARNLGRVDRYALMRILRRRIVSPILGVALVASVLPLVIAVTQVNRYLEIGQYRVEAATVAIGITLAFLATGVVHTIFRYLRGRAVTYLPGELFFGPAPGGLTTENVGDRSIDFTDPLRRARIGSLYLYQHNVGDVLDDLASAGYEMIMFVDDLDRCRSNTTAEVVEAINLFLSSLTFDNALPVRFVMGLDPSVIASHLDSIYRSQPDVDLDLGALGDDPGPGWAFLRKLVQLPVIVPRIPDSGIDRFVELATASNGAVHSLAQRAIGTVRPLGGNAASRARGAEPTNSPGHGRSNAVVDADSTREPFPIDVIPWRTADRHPGVREMLRSRLLGQPERSIREAKRLLNVWQLYMRLLEATDPLTDPQAVLVRARHLVILAEVITRWPALQQTLHRRIGDKRGLQILAAAAGDDEAWDAATTRMHLGGRLYSQSLSGLRRVLADNQGTAVADLAARLL